MSKRCLPQKKSIMKKKYQPFYRALEKSLDQKESSEPGYIPPIDRVYPSYSEQKILNFTSNDFLALSKHPHVKKNTIKYILEWGVGKVGSRLMTKDLEHYRNVEEKLAELLGKETSLLCSSPDQMQQTFLSALGRNNSFFFIDCFCQNSLMQVASMKESKLFCYEHQNHTQLRSLLEKSKKTPCFAKVIISESLFGVNGEICDLKSLIELAKEYDAILYVDDSHSVGLMGKHGMGLSSHRAGVDIITGTLGNACDAFGAYAGLSRLMRDYFFAFAPQLIEITKPPPTVLGAISGALDLIPDMQIERNKVLTQSEQLKKELHTYGWDTGKSHLHIISLILPSKNETLKIRQALMERGILTIPLIPPAIQTDTSRLKLIVNALHTKEQITTLVTTLKHLNPHSSSIWKRKTYTNCTK